MNIFLNTFGKGDTSKLALHEMTRLSIGKGDTSQTCSS